MFNQQMERILIVGDGYGVPELLERVPKDNVLTIIAAENRPHYHEELRSIAKSSGSSFIIQPYALNKSAYCKFISSIRELNPDGLLCHSYSMLIQPEILQLVGGQAFNIHASLLPKNRGPNPVQWALIHGEEKTGVTLHVMDRDIDCGAIVDQIEVDILISDTWVTLMERVKSASCRLMDRALLKVLEGTWEGQNQDSSLVTINHRIPQESFMIDFSSMSDVEIFNLIRAQTSPLAGAYLDTPRGRRRFPDYLTLKQVALLRKEYKQRA